MGGGQANRIRRQSRKFALLQFQKSKKKARSQEALRIFLELKQNVKEARSGSQ